VFESSRGFDLAAGEAVESDVTFASNQRWRTPDKPIRGFLEIAPDPVFEILSPSTRHLDLREKKRIYQGNDVEEHVLVDPISRSLRQFHLIDGCYGPAPVRDREHRSITGAARLHDGRRGVVSRGVTVIPCRFFRGCTGTLPGTPCRVTPGRGPT
jgi:hypothetical protein